MTKVGADEEQLPPPEDEYQPRQNDGEGYDAGTKKKKKKAAQGCSAAPGSIPSSSGGFAFAVGLAVAAVNRRRRVQRRRGRPRGLAAFESAPCYLELLEHEASEDKSRQSER